MPLRSFPSFTVFILSIQYTIGYLAAGFLVSVPIQLLWVEVWADLIPSLARGLICLLGFLVFYPIVRYFDWQNMKLPEFKLFELAVTRNAALLSLALLLISLVDERIGSRRMMWLLFLLEGIAWIKIKAHTLIFREFYDIADSQNQQEWYEELSQGIKAQASQVGDRIASQAREVRGQLRERVLSLARIVGVKPEPVEAHGEFELAQLVQPAPCRYHGRGSHMRLLGSHMRLLVAPQDFKLTGQQEVANSELSLQSGRFQEELPVDPEHLSSHGLGTVALPNEDSPRLSQPLAQIGIGDQAGQSSSQLTGGGRVDQQARTAGQNDL